MRRLALQKGFTLAEISVVMIIVALLTAGALSALRIQTRHAEQADSRLQLEEARQALLNFSAVEERLPCPDLNNDGSSEPCGTDAVLRGWLPWRDLALQSTDPWEQSLRYAVDRGFTQQGIRLSDVGHLNMVAIGETDPVANPSAVVAALWSTGSDAKDASATAGPSTIVVSGPAADDIVFWLSRFVVIGRIIEAGRQIEP